MRFCQVLSAALVLAAASAAPAAAAPVREKLVVMELRAERGIEEGVVRLLDEVVLTEFARSGVYEILGGADVSRMLQFERTRQLAGCADDACLAEIGGALGARFLAVASLGRVGDFFIVNMKLIDVRSARVDARWSETVPGSENELMGAVRRGVASLLILPQPASAKRSAWPWVAFGTSGAAALAGGVFAWSAWSATQSRNAAGDPAKFDELHANAERRALGANVSFGVAAAAAATGAVLWFVTGRPEAPSAGAAGR